MLEAVRRTKVTGEEEAYSHIDFVDIGANISGALEAFFAVKPLIKDQKLVTLLQERFRAALGALVPYRKGNDFVLDSTVTLVQRTELSDVINRLSEPLSALAAAVS